jgi:hypothetical protein
MGADGAPSIDSGGKTYIDVRNLGYEGGSSYTYWAEVYRFPIDAKTKTMQSFFYMVKSTEKIIGGQVDFIGDYFGVVGTSTPRSMFTVNTNEVGRCYIGINPLNDSLTPTVTDSLTLSNLIYSFYYFETTIARYSHLEDASAGTTTRYFTGFNYKGTVQTDIRAYRSGPKGSIINSIVTFLATTYIADLIVIELGLFKVEVTEWLGVTYTQSTSFGIYLMDAAGIDVGGAQTLVEYLANAYSASAESGLISKVLLDVTNAQTALANGVPVAEALAAPETTAFLVELGIEESIAIAVPPVALAVGVVLIAPKVVQFVEDHPVESVAIIGAILCGGICFTGDTVVKTADGSYKKISEFSGGEEVLNHDGSSVNKVRLVIKNLDYTGTLCGLESDPFVTVNHPLIINGRLSSFNPEHIIENNPWLGPCEKISSSSNREAQGETVYNLLVTGDGTYTVNNIGTTSVFGSGGVLVDCMHQGLISEDQVFAIIKKYHDLGGSQLANFYQIIHSKEYNDISQASTSIAKLM